MCCIRKARFMNVSFFIVKKHTLRSVLLFTIKKLTSINLAFLMHSTSKCPKRFEFVVVIGMCREGIQQGTRMYLDSTLFSGDFSRCSCSLSVVSAAGGSVDIYPTTIDHSNCKVSMDIDVLKYSLDCHRNDDQAQSFLHSSDSLSLDISGEGAARYCLLIQTKATEVRLQLQCFPGRPVGSENMTTSTTTYTSETPYVTTEVASTPTPTPSTTTSTTTITSATFSTTESPETTSRPTSATTSRTTTVTSAVPSTSPTEITAAPVTSQTTTTTMISDSSSTENITVIDDKHATLQTFPVLEVTAGVSAGAVVLLVIVAILLCNRCQKNHRGDEEDERKQPIAGYANSEYASSNVAVLNPLYSEGTEEELSPEPGSIPEEQEYDESSSSSEGPPSQSVDQAVTEVHTQQVELTYALVNKPGSGFSDCSMAPDTRKIEGSVCGLYRL
ncbi:cell wall protein DAN4-like [Haliotis rubra]|uniref:cell wall protein DAN4-like n=1 Tax=Haliotis rubra TaxID=36100 RepID=UPI001EE4F2D2|nr:cell wall protein DAN4-like [Haliotis rubra]